MKKRVAKMFYRFYIRPNLEKYAKRSDNKFDDEMLKLLDQFIKEW